MDIETVEFEPAAPPPDAELARIAELAEAQRRAEDRVAACTAALRAALDEYHSIASHDLPDAMTSCGVSEFKLTDGTKVTIDRRFVGGKLTDPEGLEWVAGHGGAELIDVRIEVVMPAGMMDEARQVYEHLRALPGANRWRKCALERSVHQSRVGAFAKERVAVNDPPPLDALGVVHRTIARVGANRRFRDVDLKGMEPK